MYKVKPDGFQLDNSHIIENEKLKNEIFKLARKHSPEKIFEVLFDFFKDLEEFNNFNYIERIKTIKMSETHEEVFDDIPDIPKIKDENDNYYLINKEKLSMERNPDLFNWDTIAQTRCNVIALDISPLKNYIKKQTFVPKGVDTKMIEWCDDICKLVTPGGEIFVDIPKEQFIKRTRIELISNLVANRIKEIIAISEDTIYFKPLRSISYEFVRLELKNGDIIDLKTKVKIRNRE
jgi:hypothetical protein